MDLLLQEGGMFHKISEYRTSLLHPGWLFSLFLIQSLLRTSVAVITDEELELMKSL